MRGRGAGAKSAPQEMGQIRPRPLRVCVNIPAVAERECQNPPASAPQPPRACVNVALGCSLLILFTRHMHKKN